MNQLRNQAEKLRESGYSYSYINNKLGVALSTMSYWFRDRPYTPNQEMLARIKAGPAKAGEIKHQRRLHETQSLMKKGIRELGKLTERDLWLLGLGVYIGEGAKTTGIIRISNSDPNIIRLSIAWLKHVGNLTNDNFAIRLHVYPDTNLQKATEYWSEVTGFGENNFRRASVDKRINKQKSHVGRLPYGTAHVTVVSRGDREKGVRLFRRINGWIQGATSQV